MKQEQHVEIFCSYAHEDQVFVQQLKTHFAPLVRLHSWVFWTDMEISAGEEWEPTIQEHLNTAQIILLLVSPDFMASDYCYGKEMQRAIERHEQKEARVIPILVRPVAFWKQAPFGKLQALPVGSKPITDRYWHTLDDALAHIVEKVSQTMSQYARESATRRMKSISSVPEPLLSDLSLVPDSFVQVMKAGTKVFAYQADAYVFLTDLIKRYGAREAIFLQYSSLTSLGLLRTLLRMGASVTVFMQHEDTPAVLGSHRQADRISDTMKSLRADLGSDLPGLEKLEVYKYRAPSSISAIKIDQRVLSMGWYAYEQVDRADYSFHREDSIAISGHDRAAVVAWEGTEEFKALDKTFSTLEANYRIHAERASL